jgi:enamine deaminase RidA (YjgF/YER057c/UK114 family)
MRILNPPGWPRPKGYSNGIEASGRFVFVAGMVGWDSNCVVVSDALVDQTRVALENIVAVLREADARPEHIARMTWYITDRQDYLDHATEIGAVYREVIGRHYPVMSVVQVSGLIEEGAKVEIEATAVVPESV